MHESSDVLCLLYSEDVTASHDFSPFHNVNWHPGEWRQKSHAELGQLRLNSSSLRLSSLHVVLSSRDVNASDKVHAPTGWHHLKFILALSSYSFPFFEKTAGNMWGTVSSYFEKKKNACAHLDQRYFANIVFWSFLGACCGYFPFILRWGKEKPTSVSTGIQALASFALNFLTQICLWKWLRAMLPGWYSCHPVG